MIIEIGCNQDVTFLLSKYNKTKEVIWENDKNTYIVTAKSNGSIIGFAFVFRRNIPVPVENIKEDFINVIEIFNEDERGRGVGTALVQEIIKKAKNDNIYQVRAYCDINNIASHYLWLKNGFGISPVKIKEDIVGSFATFGL